MMTMTISEETQLEVRWREPQPLLSAIGPASEFYLPTPCAVWLADGRNHCRSERKISHAWRHGHTSEQSRG
jgi:hypothetical protein